MLFKDYFNEKKRMIGLSLAEIAAQFNLHGYEITKSTIGGWASGKRNPQLDKKEVREAIAAVLQVDVNEMMTTLGFVILDEHRSPEALRAASLIDSLPEEERRKAVRMLEVMVHS